MIQKQEHDKNQPGRNDDQDQEQSRVKEDGGKH
jgi:hypothetical protein